MNYYQATPTKPFHLSIGAVIVNAENYVYCHYWKQKGVFKDVYSLMHETLEPNETIEAALHRGMMEEFGITGEIIDYMGTYNWHSEWFGEIGKPVLVEKSTIYFLVKELTFNPKIRLKNDPESDSEILCVPYTKIIEATENQWEKYGLPLIDEMGIVERAMERLGIEIKE